jgi:hypothetical protein
MGSSKTPPSGITDKQADAIVDQILAANDLTKASKPQTFLGSLGDQGGQALHIFHRGDDLSNVDGGTLVPDPRSRLGAYAATRGYSPGTVGDAVHNAIGFIYDVFGTYGEEQIGVVFSSPQAHALYKDPVDGPSGYEMAQIEYAYWRKALGEDWTSGGGLLGSTFPTTVRDYLQRHYFKTSTEPPDTTPFVPIPWGTI